MHNQGYPDAGVCAFGIILVQVCVQSQISPFRCVHNHDYPGLGVCIITIIVIQVCAQSGLSWFMYVFNKDDPGSCVCTIRIILVQVCEQSLISYCDDNRASTVENIVNIRVPITNTPFVFIFYSFQF